MNVRIAACALAFAWLVLLAVVAFANNVGGVGFIGTMMAPTDGLPATTPLPADAIVTESDVGIITENDIQLVEE